jgi:hypothetical protein
MALGNAALDAGVAQAAQRGTALKPVRARVGLHVESS